MNKTLQYFSDEYLQQCKGASPEAILEYLESFRLLYEAQPRTKLISIKIQQTLLENFRKKCQLHNVRYQTQIKRLMLDWLEK